jgi:hypothetical protein
MAFCIGVFDPRKKFEGLCAIPECEMPIAGELPEGSMVAEREVTRIQES